MKYVLIDWVKDGDIFIKEFETAEEAVELASYEWKHLSESDKNQKATRTGEVTSMCLSRLIRMRMRKTTTTAMK